jgi:hypothetical protein
MPPLHWQSICSGEYRQYLRQAYLSSRVFADYSAIVEAACKAWKKLLNETGRIASIATRQWTLAGQ